jgi:hypothetical protein
MVTGLLVLASVVSAVALFNALFPAINQGSDTMLSMQRRLDDQARTQVEVVHAINYGVSSDIAYVWVKNVGSNTISAVESCDVFFGPEGNWSRLAYGTGDGEWQYTIENDTTWKPTATVKLIIDYTENLSNGERYFCKIVLPNGISDDYFFTK